MERPQAVRQEIAKVENKGREVQLREVRQERLEAYEENVSQVRERIPDFDKVLASAKASTSVRRLPMKSCRPKSRRCSNTTSPKTPTKYAI
jgi:hypothetical protein